MRQKGFALILIVIILALIGIVAAYYFGTRKGNIIPSPTKITPSTTANPTTNWKIYVDKKYVYSFKYPALWEDKTDANDKSLGNFTIETDEGEKIHGAIFSGIPDPENDNSNYGASKSFIISSKTYLLVTYVECDGPGCLLGSKRIDVFNQILSTFRFAK